MNPGKIILPVQSILSILERSTPEVSTLVVSIRVIRLPEMVTSARTGSAPVPSTIEPPTSTSSRWVESRIKDNSTFRSRLSD